MPWSEVAVDVIGPWNLNVNGRKIEFIALMCIDPVTNVVELIRLRNKTAQHVAEQFENVWLARYPRPLAPTLFDVQSIEQSRPPQEH